MPFARTSTVAVLMLGALAVACGARTGLTTPDADAESDAEAPLSDSGTMARACGNLPTAGLPGEYNAELCTDPTQCDDFGGANVCPCAGAASPQICGFEAIHDDGHIFTSQCDPSSGECQCIIDGNACTCQSSAHPAGLCTLGSPLNCCF